MAKYHYKSTDGVNYSYNGHLDEISDEYLYYEAKSFGEVSLYYKTQDEKVTDIIAESVGSEANARREIKETFSWVKEIN